jgi:uncharacterized membrane protein YbhN (UPF0104 family)
MKATFRAALALAVAAGLLALLFQGTDWAALGQALRDMDLGWLLLAQVLLWASFFTRAQRWSYVVRAVHPASFRHLLSATQIGFLINFTVPARLGELARATVLSRLTGLAVPRSLAMVALDRVNDVIGLLPVLAVGSLALAAEARVELPVGSFGNTEPIRLSASLVRPAAWGVVAAVGIAGLGLVVLYAQRDRVLKAVRRGLGFLPAALLGRIEALLVGFADGLHVFRSRSDLLRAILWSFATWAADVASLAAVLVASDVSAPWTTPFLMLGLIAVAIAVPITPGTVGQFHLPAVAGLLLAAPDVDPARAKAVAIVDHASTLVPIAALGIFSLVRERLGWTEVIRGSEASRGLQSSLPPSGSDPPPTR